MTVSTSPYTPGSEATNALKAALGDLPEEWIRCRDMRHAWDVHRDYYLERDVNVSKGNIVRELKCLRCGMLRIERYAHTKMGLDKVAQKYAEAPEGYYLKNVPRGVKPQEVLRNELYERSMRRIVEQSRT